MAVPFIKARIDCADFDKTVLPYIYQLYDLPERALQVLQRQQHPLAFYTTTNPLVFGFALSLFLSPSKRVSWNRSRIQPNMIVFLVISEYHRNYSWVDRFWSILPTIYVSHYALYAYLTGIPTGRIYLASLAYTIWGVSLIPGISFVMLTVWGSSDLQLLAQRRL